MKKQTIIGYAPFVRGVIFGLGIVTTIYYSIAIGASIAFCSLYLSYCDKLQDKP